MKGFRAAGENAEQMGKFIKEPLLSAIESLSRTVPDGEIRVVTLQRRPWLMTILTGPPPPQLQIKLHVEEQRHMPHDEILIFPNT